jgi:hypothetical protein
VLHVDSGVPEVTLSGANVDGMSGRRLTVEKAVMGWQKERENDNRNTIMRKDVRISMKIVMKRKADVKRSRV